jgi:selenocysteine lyase/cysteine desulfurase
LGPQGTGGLYIAPGIRLETLREGGTGTDSHSLAQPDTLPERYESGTVNLPGIAGLAAGCDYVAPRLSQIMMHERELTQALHEGLSAMDGVTVYSPAQESGRAGIVSFNVADCPASQIADALDRRGIAVRGGLHCAPGAHRFLGTLNRGAVRASLGHANTFGEVEQFLESVRELL